jgi:hypothetical protein
MTEDRPRIVTPSQGSAIVEEVEPEPTAPTNLSQLDRIEWRQIQAREDMRELARGLGEVKTGLAEARSEAERTAAAAEALLELADKSDKRAERREEIAALARQRREDREAAERAAATAAEIEDRKAERETQRVALVRRSKSREKIALAIIGAIVSLVGAYAIGHRVGTDDAPAPAVQK